MHKKPVVIVALLLASAGTVGWSRVSGNGQAAEHSADRSAAAQDNHQSTSGASKTEDGSTSTQSQSSSTEGISFLANRHRKNGLSCESCHDESEPKDAPTTEKCLQCHESFEALAKKTTDMAPNPHDNHFVRASDTSCDSCHHGHKTDEVACKQCHAEVIFMRNSNPDALKKQ